MQNANPVVIGDATCMEYALEVAAKYLIFI